jgi:hypothetical protein
MVTKSAWRNSSSFVTNAPRGLSDFEREVLPPDDDLHTKGKTDARDRFADISVRPYGPNAAQEPHVPSGADAGSSGCPRRFPDFRGRALERFAAWVEQDQSANSSEKF